MEEELYSYEIPDNDFFLAHYGTPRHSGRYPWGSGENPYQHNAEFLRTVQRMKKEGVSEKDIAVQLGYKNTSELRNKIAAATIENRQRDIEAVNKLYNSIDPDTGKQYTKTKIGHKLGISESTVRSLLNVESQKRANRRDETVQMLKDQVAKKKYIDIGAGAEIQAGVSRDMLKKCVAQLKEEGYSVQYHDVEQLGTGKKTSLMILAAPGTEWKEVAANKEKISQIEDYREANKDIGTTSLGIKPPVSIDSKRVLIRYKEDQDENGAYGIDRDGVMQIRRGVKDISLGDNLYCQVRIAVDGTHYLKGMAVYSDNLPDGVDIIFNTNKDRSIPPEKVFKKMKTKLDDNGNEVIDIDNPFGAQIKKQLEYTDKNGEKKLSPVNIVNEEGDWGKWKKSIASQVLSKQAPSLAKKQLNLAYQEKKQEYMDILGYTNPEIRKRLLESFQSDCDSAAVTLKAAALPRQRSHVILPVPSLKDNEIYAPQYRDGEKVVLIRYPHGGIFEIPELVVNNKNKEALSFMGQATDAVGINKHVADRLSGADFDGDTVLVIPNNNGEIHTKPLLEGLKDFDPSAAYPKYPGMRVITNQEKQIEMGKVTNLITDMTIRGAKDDEIARATRHSMVIIDAEKHELDYKKSYVDNGIAELKRKYQGGANAGASTLISRASSETHIDERKDYQLRSNTIDPETGKKIFQYTGRTYTTDIAKDAREFLTKVEFMRSSGKSGIDISKDLGLKSEAQLNRKISAAEKKVADPFRTKAATSTSTQMYDHEDAYELSSGTPIEDIYASYANSMKGLANSARKEWLTTGNSKYNPSAAKQYAEEVSSLKAKLNIALKNAPYERQAQILANATVAMKKKDNPDMTKDQLKKVKSQALISARQRVSPNPSKPGKQQIDISPKEWEAISNGALTSSVITKVLQNTDLDKVKEYATPREKVSLTPAKQSMIKTMLSAGYSQAEIADRVGVSTTTINKVKNGEM